MQLTLRPTQFDVILTTNMFGDILSDARRASRIDWPRAFGSSGTGAPLFEPISWIGANLVARTRQSHRRDS